MHLFVDHCAPYSIDRYCPTTSLSLLPAFPPVIQSFLPFSEVPSASLTHQAPTSSSNDILHPPLLPNESSQTLRSGLPRGEPRRVGI